MKKLLLGAIALSLFAIALTVVQMSCSKSNAQSSRTTAQINKIIYQKYFGTSTGIFIANYDGSGQRKLNITFPSGYAAYNYSAPTLSPDGAKVFFILVDGTGTRTIFSCDTSGANLNPIVVCSNAADAQLGGAY